VEPIPSQQPVFYLTTWCFKAPSMTGSSEGLKQLRRYYFTQNITFKIPAFSPAISPRVFPVNKVNQTDLSRNG